MNGHVESALYYTLSTVAQTLAGAIGLLGAIALFALQAAASSIERAAERLSQVPHESLSPLYIRHLFSRRSYAELARRYDEMVKPSSEISSDVLVYHSALRWELQHEHVIRTYFWKALLASGVVIVFAIASSALVPEIAFHPAIGQLILGLAATGAAGCLLLYGFLLRAVIRRTPEDTLRES
jgi:hypothetical protein